MATRSKKNAPKKSRKKNGTKKGQVRKTARRAYEKNQPAMFKNPAMQAVVGGALAVVVDRAAGMLGAGGPMIGPLVKAGVGFALGNKRVFNGNYAAAGGAMIGIAAYQLVSGFTTGGLAAAPYGPPWVGSTPLTGGLAYDPVGAQTLNYGNVANQYA